MTQDFYLQVSDGNTKMQSLMKSWEECVQTSKLFVISLFFAGLIDGENKGKYLEYFDETRPHITIVFGLKSADTEVNMDP